MTHAHAAHSTPLRSCCMQARLSQPLRHCKPAQCTLPTRFMNQPPAFPPLPPTHALVAQVDAHGLGPSAAAGAQHCQPDIIRRRWGRGRRRGTGSLQGPADIANAGSLPCCFSGQRIGLHASALQQPWLCKGGMQGGYRVRTISRLCGSGDI